jgi:hypothetical protein
MRVIAMTVVALMSLGAASAFANPISAEWMYIDFDPPNRVHSTYPAPYSVVEAYLVLDLSLSYWDNFTTASFALSVSPDVALAPSFVNLLPGNLAIGDWQTGITVASTECIHAMPAQIGFVSFVYGGVPGDVEIVDHPDYPRWVTDCQDPGEVFWYCVYSNGGVGKEPDIGPEGDCAINPVEHSTWGGIKSMYQ